MRVFESAVEGRGRCGWRPSSPVQSWRNRSSFYEAVRSCCSPGAVGRSSAEPTSERAAPADETPPFLSASTAFSSSPFSVLYHAPTLAGTHAKLLAPSPSRSSRRFARKPSLNSFTRRPSQAAMFTALSLALLASVVRGAVTPTGPGASPLFSSRGTATLTCSSKRPQRLVQRLSSLRPSVYATLLTEVLNARSEPPAPSSTIWTPPA